MDFKKIHTVAFQQTIAKMMFVSIFLYCPIFFSTFFLQSREANPLQQTTEIEISKDETLLDKDADDIEIFMRQAKISFSFDILNIGQEQNAIIMIGTPPKSYMLRVTGDMCGIILWRETPYYSISWVSATQSDTGYGMDYVMTDSMRAFLPLRFVDSGDELGLYDVTSDSDGILGVCPEVLEQWRIQPIYSARCSVMSLGSETYPWCDRECKSTSTMIMNHRSIHAKQKPWVVEGCIIKGGGTKMAEFDPLAEALSSPMRMAPMGTYNGRSGSAMFGASISDGWLDYVVAQNEMCRENRSELVKYSETSKYAGIPMLHLPRDELEFGRSDVKDRRIFSGSDCTTIATTVSTKKSVAEIHSCISCERGKMATFFALSLVCIFGAVWGILASMRKRELKASFLVAIFSASAISFLYFSTLFGTNSGYNASFVSGIPRVVVETFFFVFVPLPAILGVVARFIGTKPILSNPFKRIVVSQIEPSERAVVEIPMYLCLLYVLFSERRFMSRMLLTIGAGLVGAVMTTTIALATANKKTKHFNITWLLVCFVAGIVNTGIFALTVFPWLTIFFGTAVPTKIIILSSFILCTAFPALVIRGKR